MSLVKAIIPAAGLGSRMSSSSYKQFLEIGGKPVIVHTLEKFQQATAVNEMVVVLPPGKVEAFSKRIAAYSFHKPLHFVAGGERRQDSVYQGFLSLNGEETQIVVVHDAVRPLVPADLIQRVVERARLTGAAIAAIPSVDTIKEVSPHGVVVCTPERSALRQTQTPQAFAYPILREAFRRAYADGYYGTDDSSLVERIGVPVAVVPGSPLNIKITTSEDVRLAEFILREKRERLAMYRVGIGYDLHLLTEGRPLVLGGVTIPFPKGLEGHSDADVLTHSLCDALLGAAGKGDIGYHFPDTSPQYKDVSSLLLLEKVMELISKEGYSVANVDVVVVAERPRLAPYIEQMRDNLSRVIKIEPGRISIKATTSEGLGHVGREEAIAAQTVALVSKPD